MKINSICILGGGTAGFSIASLLSKYNQVSGSKFNIKLVYSKDIGSIGVGESTVRNVNEFLKYLGLDDKTWMKDCDATYKTAIRFKDFNKGSHFYFPFGVIPNDRNRYQILNSWYLSREFYPEIYTSERLATYFLPHNILTEKNKLCNNDAYDLNSNTAYHFDANKLTNLLQKYSEDNGVEVIDDKFIEALLNDDGSIKRLICENNTYDADLFIDCSGFKSLLLGKAMGEEFIPFTNTLINNKAIVASIPYTNKKDQLKNYTDSIALRNGWCWEIPLWNCMSVGYVHTNQFATEEEIEQEFFDRYGEVEYKTIEYKTGRYERGWVKNVVGIGLAYGFIEPLESTGLATTFTNCFRLLESISKRGANYTQIDRDVFNNSIGQYGVDAWRTQIEMHYYLSTRTDSDYWKYVTEHINYRNGIDSEFAYENFLYKSAITRNLFPNGEPGPMYISLGMGYSPFSRAMILRDAFEPPDIREFNQSLDNLEKFAEDLPSTFEFLQDTIYT